MHNLFTLVIALFAALSLQTSAQVNPITAAQGGGQNYILNGGFENARHGWLSYANTAQSTPVTGAGGTATATLTTTTSALAGKASGLINHPASNVQGNGFAYAFKLEPGAAGRVISITGQYQLASGTYTSSTATTESDIELFVYDVDSGTLIYPYAWKLDGIVGSTNYAINTSFMPVSQTSVNYRLIFHAATANTNAFTMKIDSLFVGLSARAQGSVVYDYKVTGTTVLTATTTAPTKGTTSSDFVGFGRVGDQAHVVMGFKQTAAGSSGSGDILVQLPAGLAFDSNKVTFLTGAIGNGAVILNSVGLGSATLQSGSGTAYASVGVIIPYDATRFRVYTLSAPAGGGSAGGGVWGSSFPLSGGILSFTADFFAPIAGWSSGTAQNGDYDGQATTWVGGNASGLNASANTNIPLTSVGDRAGAWNGTAYVVQKPGDYTVLGNFISTPTGGAGFVALNGTRYNNNYFSTVSAANALSSGGTTLYGLKPGDQISLQTTTAGNISSISFSVSRAVGSAVVQPADPVSMEYYNSSGSAIGTSLAAVTGWTKIYDTTGGSTFSPTTGIFTAILPGKYQFLGTMSTAATGWAVNSVFKGTLKKNAACGTTGAEPDRSFLGISPVAYNGGLGSQFIGTFQLNPGDYVILCASSSVATSLATITDYNHLSITRVSN